MFEYLPSTRGLAGMKSIPQYCLYFDAMPGYPASGKTEKAVNPDVLYYLCHEINNIILQYTNYVLYFDNETVI